MTRDIKNIIREAIKEVCFKTVYMGNESIGIMSDLIIKDLRQSGFEIVKIDRKDK